MFVCGVPIAYLPPRVLVAGAGEHGGGAAQRHDLQVLAAELGRHGELLPALPARLALAELRHHRRVVGHLATLPISQPDA